MARRSPSRRRRTSTVGERLARARKAKRLTGQQLATRAEVSIDTVRSIESGRIANPGINTVGKLADVLQTSLDELAGRTQRRGLR